jgi:chemotaxis protein histidine kinase CheA
MSSSRLLDFFVLEATDYIDRLDSLLSEGGGTQPDAESLTAQARLLRGSATMARQLPIADLSSALERIGRALRDGIVEWNGELHAALVAAVDDLKILIRAVRSWGAGDDRRTEERITELVSLYPQASKTRPTPPVNPRNSSFIASESAQLASALDSLVAHPSASDTLAVAVHRLNSLRGVAAINDTPPLPQVLGALDDILRPLHASGAIMETQHLAVLTSAVQLLRRFSQEIAIGGALDTGSQVVLDFTAALSGLSKTEASTADSVIPISRLNFEDGLPQLVSAGAQAPATARQRFRLEVAGPCEHLRHQVALARAATDELSRRRAADEMRASMRVLRAIAGGFEDADVVAFVDIVLPQPGDLTPRALTLVDELARALIDESDDRRVAFARMQALIDAKPAASAGEPTSSRPAGRTGAPAASATSAVVPPAVASTSSEAVAPAAAASSAAHAVADQAPVRKTPPLSGSGLSTMLSAGLAGLSSLEQRPLSEPVHVVEEDVVPIANLLYRGRDALLRAQEIREAILARVGAGAGTGVPHTEELNELFELLDLAATE